MQPGYHLMSAIALACLSTSSWAVTTTYTSTASFMSQVRAGSYTESFTTAAPPPTGAASFSGGAFAYNVSSPGDLYASGEFLGTNLPNFALTITFTSGNVTAVGGNFYATNISNAFQPATITLTMSDGTTAAFASTSVTDFRGFTSTSAITSLTMSSPGVSLYAGIDNLTVGAAVPEPASWLLMGLGVAGLVAARRRTAA